MRKESFIQHTPYLSAMAVAMGYSLDASFDEGERWGRVTLNPSDDGPVLFIDTVNNSGRLSWSTLLPTDRWGYAHREHGCESRADGTFDPDKNTPERAAARITAALNDYAHHHAGHVGKCHAIQSAYDKQQGVASAMLYGLPGYNASAYNMGHKPNHNGEAPITISAPGKYASAKVGYGGSIDLTIGSVTPEQACVILRILWAEE